METKIAIPLFEKYRFIRIILSPLRIAYLSNKKHPQTEIFAK
jgi:hypothetical protein